MCGEFDVTFNILLNRLFIQLKKFKLKYEILFVIK